MKTRIAVVFLAALFLLVLHTCAFAACTCWVNGRISLHYTCAATTIGLWVYAPTDIYETQWEWFQVGTRTLMDNETFSFTVACPFGNCNGPAEIRSRGDVLLEFTLPGRSETINLGTVYDFHHCSKHKESAMPPPMP
jgi:hypothetical protein